jgi:hypothetical protein
MELEVTPPQPDEVTRELAAALARDRQQPDPWWQAGIEDALGE